MANIPNDEIWYTTWYNKLLNIESLDLNVEILSNTYNNGKGVIKFNGNLTSIKINNRILKSIELPNSVTSIGNSAFSGCSGLTSVTIPDSVTSIETGAFQGCSGLTSITIPNSVTTIGNYAFGGCSSLTSVTIGNSVTSIGGYSFQGCSGLTSVTVPNSVTSIGSNAFYAIRNVNYNGSANGSPWGAKCVNGYVEDGLVYTDNTKTTLVSVGTSLTSVTIPDSVTSIGNGAFQGCTGLTSVIIPDSVENIGSNAFNYCTSLTSVNIPDSVENIGSNTFTDCTNLTSITIPDSVTTIGTYAFQGCSGLTSVTIGNSVTSIENGAFQGCSGLTSITIPNSVTSIGNYAFSGCNGLTSVTIGNSVTSIGNSAFSGCTGLTSVTIPDSVTTIGTYAFYNCTSLTSVTIPNFVESIKDYVFQNCTNLTSVTIPNSVTSIGNSAFSGCSGLTSVTVPNSVTSIGSNAFNSVRNVNYNGSVPINYWGAKYVNGYVENGLVYTDNTKTTLVSVDTSLTSVIIPNSVKNIVSYTFADCTNLTSVTIPNSVKSVGYNVFSGCTNLTSVTIPNSVTSIGSYTFGGCSSLTSVTIGNSVTSIGYYAFNECTSLTSITIPNSVMSIEPYAFHNCTGLTSVTIPGLVKSIEGNVFRGCIGLTSVTIPNSVTSIGTYAFGDCKNLISVTIPNSVTSIGNGAFYNCKNLTSVTIGNSVTSIEGNVFQNCYSLTSVTVPNSVTSIGSNAFYGVGNVNYNGSANGSPWGAKCVNGYIEDGLVYTDNTKTTLVSVDNSLTSVTIPDSVESIGSNAFYNCTGLTSVTIPDSVENIGNSAFSGCNGLTSVTIGNSVTNIGNSAFKGCSGLTSVTVPNSVTSIGSNAFYAIRNVNYNGSANGSPWGAKCVNGYVEDGLVYTDNTKTTLVSVGTSLTSVTIPNTVNMVYDGVFYYNDKLQSIVIPKSEIIDSSDFSGKVFNELDSPLSSITILDQNPNDVHLSGLYVDNIYVPQNCLKLYEYLYKDDEFMLSKLRAIPLNIRFRKKEYNESEDNESGVIIFDESKKTIYLDGVDYTQNVIDASKLRGEIPSECYKDTTLSGVAYCSTAAATAAKKATMPGFELVTGQRIFLQTTNKNSATSNVTLSVNDTEAKPIKIGTANPSTSNFPVGWWIAHYDGTNWVLTRIYLTDSNTDTKVTQSATTSGGYRKILLGYGSYTETGTEISNSITNTVYETVDVEVQPSTGKIFANEFVKNDGTSSQFLKADGSVDENTYSLSSHDHSGVYKPIQTAVSDPSVPTSGATTSTTFIDTISQDTNGVITATKKTLPTASESTEGIIKIGTTSTTAAAGNHTHTFESLTSKPTTLAGYGITDATDTKVTSVDNHYTPETDEDASSSATASGGSNLAWSASVVTGVTINKDAKGHVTGVDVTSSKLPANPNTDTKVTQSYASASGYTYWRPLVIGYSSNSNEGFTPSGTTSTTYTFSTLTCQPSSGTIRARHFKVIDGTSSQFLKADGSVDDNTYSKSSLTQTKNYTSNSAFYTNGSFTYFNSSDYMTSISSVNNSYTLVEFNDASVTTTGTSINIPFNFPTVSGYLVGNENIHHFLLKNISNSNITLTLVPPIIQSVCIIGNLTPITLQSNNSIEISTKVMNDNWIISKSIEMPITQKPKNVIYYTTSDGNVADIDESVNYSGANIVNNAYENGVGIITFDNDVRSIGENAFIDCNNLTSITIPDSVTSIREEAFSGCSGLTSVTIPNSVTSIGDSAFYDCNFTSVTIGNSVTSIGNGAFQGCSGLTSITIPNSVTTIGNYAFAGCISLTSVTIGNSVTTIGESAFTDCNFTSVTIPDSVTSIVNNAFGGCSGLTSIIVSDGNNVYDSRNNCNAIIETSTNMLIAGCKNTIIPNTVTSIGAYAFYSCSGLTSVTIGNSVTSIGENAFQGCSGLTSVTIPDSVTSIRGDAFSGCTGLTSIIIPDSVTSIGNKAFGYCSGITSIIVSDGNNVYDSRNNCNAIIETSTNTLIAGCKNTIIPNTVTTIGSSAFISCGGLTSVTIPDSVTSIGNSAFYGCTGLTSVTIPNSVTTIGSSAFSYCSGLTSITSLNTTPPTLTSNSTLPTHTTYIIYVPTGSVETYKAARYWKNKASQIQAIQQ